MSIYALILDGQIAKAIFSVHSRIQTTYSCHISLEMNRTLSTIRKLPRRNRKFLSGKTGLGKKKVFAPTTSKFFPLNTSDL